MAQSWFHRISLQWVQRAGFSLLLLTSTFVIAALFVPTLRDKTKKIFTTSDRKILATLKDDLEASGRLISVFKIRESGSLYIEFYSQKKTKNESEEIKNTPYELLQKIELPGVLDGYVNFMGEATNLAVANLDEDPYLEILVPTYNLEFIPSLDVIKFNPDSKKYELISFLKIPESGLSGFSQSSLKEGQ